MKILILILSFIATSAYSQNCYYSKDEVDDMTGNSIIITKSKKIWNKLRARGPERLDVYVMKINNSKSLSLTLKLIGDPYSINEEDEVLIKIETGEVLKLINETSEVSDNVRNGSVTQWAVNYLIMLEDEDIEKLSKFKIDKIRAYTSDGYVDCEISKKRKSIIIDQLKCIQ